MKNRVLIILLVISLFLVYLGISIEINSYNKSYFKKAFIDNGVLETTGKDMDELLIIVDDIILYLKNKGGEELLSPHFNEREITHMIDVQDLFNLERSIKLISLIIVAVIAVYFISHGLENNILDGIISGFNFIYIVLAALGLLISTNFTKYFTIFHEIFFDNDLWLLNPNTDLMIQMLPEPFFINISIRILITLVILSVLTQLVCILIKKRNSKVIGD